MTYAMAVIALLLVGCASAPAVPPVVISKPVEVLVKVPVPCQVQMPERPSVMQNRDALALNDRDLVLQIASEREALTAYAAKAAAALEACQ